jgi:hypothetical protein
MQEIISHKKHKDHIEEKTFRSLNFFELFVLFVAILYRLPAIVLRKQFSQTIHET